MDEKTFCFIICTNNDILAQECQRYIERLWIPEGFNIDILTIREADSLASAYNAAMDESNAKYKVYLHQDLFIVNRWFLFNVLDIFALSDDISLIGLAGTFRLPENGIMWRGRRFGKHEPDKNDCEILNERLQNGKCFDAVAVDGAIIVTSKDIRWREDIFDGFDFYDVSECFEHRRAGFKVVIPSQNYPWCIHDDGFWMNLYNYDKYRKIFLKEYENDKFELDCYSEEFNNLCKDRDETVSSEYIKTLGFIGDKKEYYISNEKEIINKINEALIKGDYQEFMDSCVYLCKRITDDEIILSGNLQKIIYIARVTQKEIDMGVDLFISGISCSNQLLEKYMILELFLRRIEFSQDDAFDIDAYSFIDDNCISAYMVSTVLYSEHSKYSNKIKILKKIGDYFINISKNDMAVQYLAQVKLHDVYYK